MVVQSNSSKMDISQSNQQTITPMIRSVLAAVLAIDYSLLPRSFYCCESRRLGGTATTSILVYIIREQWVKWRKVSIRTHNWYLPEADSTSTQHFPTQERILKNMKFVCSLVIYTTSNMPWWKTLWQLRQIRIANESQSRTCCPQKHVR